MLQIPYPDINGVTDEERISQINDYLGRYSSSVGNAYNNIGIDNLNPSLANLISSGLQRHQPLNEYASIVRVEESKKPVDEGLDETEDMLEEKHREGFVMRPNELAYYEPQENLATLYTMNEMSEMFLTLAEMLKDYDNKYNFGVKYIKKDGLKVLTVLEILQNKGIAGLNSRLDKVEKNLK